MHVYECRPVCLGRVFPTKYIVIIARYIVLRCRTVQKQKDSQSGLITISRGNRPWSVYARVSAQVHSRHATATCRSYCGVQVYKYI